VKIKVHTYMIQSCQVQMIKNLEVRYHKISHEINTISHKIDRICPIFLYNKPILPDCGANIARLALFAQQLGGGGAGANHA
jgi:hypothetical protein